VRRCCITREEAPGRGGGSSARESLRDLDLATARFDVFVMAGIDAGGVWNHELAVGLFVWVISTLRAVGAVVRVEPSSFEVNVAYAVALGSTWLLLRGAWRCLRSQPRAIVTLPNATHPYRASIRKP
jgi:hypothetical protein